MLKTNKLVSLGVLSVIGLGLAVAPTVSADTTNTTTFGYTAGQAGGGDDSDWVLDMPVQINLSDKNTGNVEQNGAALKFSLYNAYDNGGNTKAQYTGSKTVTVKLGAVASGKISGGSVIMDKGTNKGNGQVLLSLINGSNNAVAPKANADSDNAIATLSSKTTSETGKAGITKSGTLAKGDTFNSTLSWTISQADAPSTGK